MNTKEQHMLSDEENAAIAAKLAQQRASDQAVAEFLARGGQIQQLAPGRSGAVPGMNMWGRGRKRAEPDTVVTEQAARETEQEPVPLSSDDVMPHNDADVLDTQD